MSKPLKNTGLIIKSKLTENFTTIPNSVLNDPNLTWKAKGLLCKLLSNRSDWAVYKSQLQQFSKDGRDSTSSAFNELIEARYIVSIRRHNEKGHFLGWDYVVYDEPTPTKPITDKPITENPISVNPSLINTNIKNTKEINNNTSIILGERELKSKIIFGLNLRREQFDKHLKNNTWDECYDKVKLVEMMPLIEEYKLKYQFNKIC